MNAYTNGLHCSGHGWPLHALTYSSCNYLRKTDPVNTPFMDWRRAPKALALPQELLAVHSYWESKEPFSW